ncbi:putative ankyrin repeat protein RF_0381 [Uloborus diversus]|uniref:putative ankyrin repeat protein RF_0381 n=1 Tax=Uloborus diversus TaxID=327109 RepID=UPI00240944CD|nr:putative ankyrin repeat protein RF_0381 [Uloborus diversus]
MEDTSYIFHQAVRSNNLEKVKKLLSEGVHPDEPNWINNGRPALLEATYQGNVDMVEILLNADADPNIQNMLGETALHNAFHPKTFSKELVVLLLEHGADVNVREKLNGYTPVHMVVKLCASHVSKGIKTSLLKVLQLMCAKADVKIRSVRNETALHRMTTGSVDWCEPLQILIDHGFDLNAQNDRGETGLMCSIDKRHCMMAELLVKKGAEVNIKDRHFQTALHHSAQKNLLRLVILLLDVQCDANATDLNGDTALHIAASKGLVDMVQVLVSHPGIDANIQNIVGSTPLLHAVESGFTQVVELLLEAYCDSDCEKCLLSAIDVAEENSARRWHPEIYSLLQVALEQKRDLWDEGETSL